MIVFAGARESRVAHSSGLMMLCIGLWSLTVSLESIPEFPATHNQIIDTLCYPFFFMPATALQCAMAWLGLRTHRTKVLVRLGFAISFGLCALHWNGLMEAGYRSYTWGVVRGPGRLYFLQVGFSIVWTAIAATCCVQVLRGSASTASQLGAKYFLLGMSVFVPIGFANFLANYGIPVFPMGSIGNVCLVAVLAYAAVRHRLMDIDVFIMRAAATLLASAAVVLPIAAAIIWVQRMPYGPTGGLVVGSMLLGAVVSLLMFSRFRAYVEQRVESSLFPSRRAARDAIRRLSADLVKLPHGADLDRRFGATLMEGLGVSGLATYRQREDSGQCIRTTVHGRIVAPEVIDLATLSPPLREAQQVVVLPSDPGTADVAQWEAYVPIRTNGSLLGFLLLGPKSSGAAIDDSDVTLLTLVAAQLAIALQNTTYVEEIEAQKAAIEALQKRLEAENVVLRAEVRSASRFKEIIGSSSSLQRVLAMVEQVATANTSILITGETGTGKELVARAVHELSDRRHGPLIPVNCAAIPTDLAESQFFGHERGAFTGAVAAQLGHFELADGGTIFLDEIAELPPTVQVKLLRVLQEHEVHRLGSRTVRKINVRVIAATNRDVHAAMRAGQFREDLYYRLAGVVVDVPPLRERRDDIPMLASAFLERASTTHQKTIGGFTSEAMAALRAYSWPGNIRELQNVVERAVLLCSSDVIKPEHLADVAGSAPRTEHTSLRSTLRQEKLRQVEDALAGSGGNQAAAARRLGMSRSNFARLMRSLGLKAPGPLQ